MARSTNRHDVIVVGGGPAGSSTAAFLAGKGYRVALFEKEKFPREHVGESLLPFCFTLFEDLGILEEMTRRFVRKPGVRFVTSDGSYYTTWCFDRVIHDPSHLSFQVTRAEFDEMLLNNARRLGVIVREETRVEEADLDVQDGGAPSVRVGTVGADGSRQEHEARFLVDASGRNTFLGNKMRQRQLNKDLARTALWSHYGGVDLQGGLEEGLSVIVYLGGDKKGWAWVFPLGLDRVTVGFVTDNEYLRVKKGELEGEHGSDWKLALFEEEIQRSPWIRKVLSGSRRTKPLFVNGDYSYSVETKYGTNFALVGDAGQFIDPIFSSGIFLSMKSARLVADALDQILRGDDPTDQTPLDSAYAHINGAYKFVHRMIKLFYNPHALSWAKASTVVPNSESARRHADAMAAGHYMLAGDFFEEQEKYNAMFDLLEQPNSFARYRKLVIERDEFQDTSCRTNPEEIFPKSTSRAEVA